MTDRTPPTVGAEVELLIETQPYGPDAIARLDGMTVFIPDAAPGDRVRARITEVKPRYARAEVTSVLNPSPNRISYACPIAKECGGCQWQHLSYAAQLRAKEQAVRDALTRIGGWPEPDVHPVITSPHEFHYRNKATYHVERRGESVLAGYYGRGTSDLVPLESCPLNMESLDRALSTTIRLLNTESRFAPVAAALTGIVGRESRATGEIVLRLLLREETPLREFAHALAAEIDGLTGVTYNRTGLRSMRNDKTVFGSGMLTERVGDVEYPVSAASFFQVNPFATPALADLVREEAALTGSERLLDAYGGAGLFSAALAQRSGSVVLVEADRAATNDARRILRGIDAESVSIVEEPVDRMPPDIRADTIICDPPRQGAGPDAIRALDAIGANRMVYVACDPANLARDSALLRHLGWNLVHATPVDLFPQTYHVETVALLER